MNRLEHLMCIFREECSEVSQEVSKAMRFGLFEQRDLPTSNAERINKEFNDLLAMVEMLKDESPPLRLGRNQEMIDAKKEKVEKYLIYSAECGTLNPTDSKGEE